VIFLYPAIGLGVTALLAVGITLQQRKKRLALYAKLRAEWGRPRSTARDLPLIASYSRALPRPACGQPIIIDDRTWQDLDLDAVFQFLDRTESIIGCQSLYHRLRSTVHSPASLAAFDDLVEALRHDEATRLDVQIALGSLAGNSVYWLWTLVLEPIKPLPRWAVIYPLYAAAMVLLLVLIAVLGGPVIVFAVFGLVAGGVLRARLGRRLARVAQVPG
jgi:hypothetical protein